MAENQLKLGSRQPGSATGRPKNEKKEDRRLTGVLFASPIRL
jgi:hypothetical protein